MLKLHSDLWVAETPLRLLGLEVGARMTVVRLPGSKLLLHSPVATSDELVREVQALGSVAYLVAPNRLHHLFVADWKRACPDASIHVAPGLDSKRADLSIESVLADFDPENPPGEPVVLLAPGTRACPKCGGDLVELTVVPGGVGSDPSSPPLLLLDCEDCEIGFAQAIENDVQ